MDSDAQRYERLIQEHGLSRTHQQVLEWVPDGSRVLELGCATGFLGALLIENKHCEVVGAELDPEAARVATERGLTMHVGSLEDPAFRATIAGYFELVRAHGWLVDDAAADAWELPLGQTVLCDWQKRVRVTCAQRTSRGCFARLAKGRSSMPPLAWETEA